MAAACFDIQPYLENDVVILRPLKEDDFENLYGVASDPLVWEQHPSSDRYQKPVFTALFTDAILSKGAFAVIDKKTGRIIGSTRFHSVGETQSAIEIGWTFLGREYWGGHYNRAMKCLLMTYAFQFVDYVLFYVGEDNFRSQKAVKKIGGERIVSLEGQILEGRPTASVIFAVSKETWQSDAKEKTCR